MSDMRPDLWIGHTDMRSSNFDGSKQFCLDVGLRHVFDNEKVAIYELRGGTHLIVINDPQATSGEATFDFMVEDVDATFAQYSTLGLALSDMRRGEIHDSFDITEPGGNRIVVNSTHVEDHSLV